ncbi:MAG: hypothetical protein ACK5NK_00495 [Niabella sp.]
MKLSFLLLFQFMFFVAFGQSKVFVYYFDADFNPTIKSKAIVMGRGIKTENGVIVNFFNTKTGKVFNICSYSDSTLAILNGDNSEYYDNGKLKKSETFSNNVLNGITQSWDSTGLLIDSIVYENDKMQNSLGER